ncbi:MAG TPA: hypothetical protein VFZ11_01580 [Gemmatimonadaceae bacterium]
MPRGLLRTLLLAGALVAAAPSARAAPAQQSPDVEVFVRHGCPHCDEAAPFVERLRRERPDLAIRVRDVGEDAGARGRLRELARARGITAGVPAFLVRGELLVGWAPDGRTGTAILRLLVRGADSARPADARAPPDAGEIRAPLLGTVSATRLGLPVFSFVVGFLDGVNPCAMWALLYVLTLLVTLHDRRRMLVLGGTFVAVGGLLYFAFIAAWLELFLLVGVSRAVQVALGAGAVLAGAVHVKDFVALGRGLSLRIPDAAKPRLYRQARRILTAENLLGAMAAVALLAVLVNLVELLCTAGLPAVYTQVLASRDLGRAAYYGNLGIYVAAYVLDDAIVLGLAVLTLSRRRLQERAGRWLELLGGLLLLSLGLVLLFRPGWLA